MKLEDTAVVVLASGLSRRFGGENKLLAPLDGKPLTAHVAAYVAEADVGHRYAVVDPQAPGVGRIYSDQGFILVENPTPEEGQGAALGLGCAAACKDNHEGLFVCLGDMPFVTPKIFAMLASQIGDGDAAICTDGVRVSPPALFSKDAAKGLLRLKGDAGAKKYIESLDNVARVKMPAAQLRDIDKPEDLQA